ncbi:uncharacterized protein LOC110718546 isoform X2 [Chenopodium quinoa]|uniref:uncharacterized protein LOC110718546 isoform X2 n=1 Tax=Chenopodium quinoa TaxID=63459 RepID=UPI000B781D7E|nr:uncharacterized protein LOC110718546 isoform X2 [Chenopodium quinoa]
MDSSEELCKSSNLFDTPSSQIQSLLSNLSLTGDSTPEQNITTSLRLVTDIPGTSDASFDAVLDAHLTHVFTSSCCLSLQALNMVRLRVLLMVLPNWLPLALTS